MMDQGCGDMKAFWSLCMRTMVRHLFSVGVPGSFWKNGRHTRMADERSRAKEEEIDRRLFGLDVAADIIHGADQAGVRLDEDVLALGVQRLAFGCDAICGFLRTADEIDAGLAGMLGELLQRRLADAAGRTDEDGDETGRKGGGDAGIRGLDFWEGHHCTEERGLMWMSSQLGWDENVTWKPLYD